MPKQNPASPSTVIGKVTAILDQFALAESSLSLAQIVQRSGVRKSTAHRLLQALVDTGYVSLVVDGYAPGLKLVELGRVAQECWGLAAMLDDVLGRFSAEIGETFIFAVLDRDETHFLHVIEPPNPLRFVVRVGTRRPAAHGATGLALISCLPPSQRQAYAQNLVAFTERTETDPASWLSRIDTIAQRGYSVEYDEYIPGIGAIGLPLERHIPASLTVVGPIERMRQQEAAIINGLLRLKPQLMRLPLRLN